jgi:hypothetical protein
MPGHACNRNCRQIKKLLQLKDAIISIDSSNRDTIKSKDFSNRRDACNTIDAGESRDNCSIRDTRKTAGTTISKQQQRRAWVTPICSIVQQLKPVENSQLNPNSN